MPAPYGSPDPPEDAVSVWVRTGRGPGRLAAAFAVGALGVIVALGLAGPDSQLPRPEEAALPSRTALPTTTQTLDPLAPTPVTGTSSPRCAEIGPTGSTPLPDIAGALPGDDGRGQLPLQIRNILPNADRLDFLTKGPECSRDAHWIDPRNPGMGTGTWTAGRPFHIREGFINNATEPLGEGFDVALYVTRITLGRAEPTYSYTTDFLMRGLTDHCGPNYRTQSGPETCEWFVHDFPDGLPDGRFAIWAVWEAPCEAWVDLGFENSCEEPDDVVSLFASGFDAPYDVAAPDYSEPASY